MKTNAVHIVYTSRPDTTPKAELDALVAVYRFLVLEKGGPRDLTKNAAPKTAANGPRIKEEEKNLTWRN